MNQTKCPKGSFCRFGLRFDCPAGQYGNEMGLSINTCSGKAAAGYYTPAGSSSATQKQCPAGRYGTGRQYRRKMLGSMCERPLLRRILRVKRSSVPSWSLRRYRRFADKWMQRRLLFDSKQDDNDMYSTTALCAESKCTQGYYCPPGSISSRQHKCGNISVYCPQAVACPLLHRRLLHSQRGDCHWTDFSNSFRRNNALACVNLSQRTLLFGA